ncbi:MAG: aerotolerance-like protein [Candidatus Hydrogenedentota bacterium]
MFDMRLPYRLTAVLIPLLCAAFQSLAQEVSVKATVESDTVYVGQPFELQIVVDGTDEVEEPDISALSQFSPQFRGGENRNSQSISIVNGDVQMNVQRAYVLSYRLVVQSPGRYQIPALTVMAGGKEFQTSPIDLVAEPPTQSSACRLVVSLNKYRCYVGEPLLLRITWYISENIEGYSFQLPIANVEGLSLADLEVQRDPAKGYEALRLPIGDELAEKSQGRLDGKEYTTYTVSKVVFPKEEGEFDIPASTVTFTIQGSARRSNFDQFFRDPFFSRDRAERQTEVSSSDPIHLDVLPLPAAGRPANFSGLVGSYSVAAEAAPTEVNVGDPMTLTIKVSGIPYFGHIDLTGLNQQEQLIRDFRIPAEMAPAEMTPDAKVFRQTIRPLRAGIAAVPPIKLPYFDSSVGEYRVAQSEPIPITVYETRVVTTADIEGDAPVAANPEPAREPTPMAEGIAYNYEGPELLRRAYLPHETWLRTPLWWGILTLPPLVFAALLSLRVARARTQRAKAGAVMSLRDFEQAALAMAANSGEQQFYQSAIAIWRDYLGGKLSAPARTMTAADARPLLRQRGIGPDVISEVEAVFEACEAGRFAGADVTDANKEAIVNRMIAAAKALEQGNKS